VCSALFPPMAHTWVSGPLARTGLVHTHPLDVPPLYTMPSTWPVVRPKAIELPAPQHREWHQDTGKAAALQQAFYIL
jgi:hypothetical protein